MRIIVRDQNGNSYGIDATPGDKVAYLEDIESSRVEGLEVGFSDNFETIIVTVTLEEV